jgi:hypothetical protein
MHRGPLLAYLMADPELSLQSILIVSAVIGRLKTFAYVGWVAIFSIAAGFAFGSWIDGANPFAITLVVLAILSLLALALRGIAYRQRHAHA